MNIQGQFVSDDERAASRLIEQACTILKGVRGDMPESFAPRRLRQESITIERRVFVSRYLIAGPVVPPLHTSFFVSVIL